jgi:hypothetical protein
MKSSAYFNATVEEVEDERREAATDRMLPLDSTFLQCLAPGKYINLEQYMELDRVKIMLEQRKTVVANLDQSDSVIAYCAADLMPCLIRGGVVVLAGGTSCNV